MYFLASGQSFTENKDTNMVTKFIRSKSVFEIDAELPLYRLDPQSNSVKRQDWPKVKTSSNWRQLKCQLKERILLEMLRDQAQCLNLKRKQQLALNRKNQSTYDR